MREITTAEVAKLAGVSTSTVSRALRDDKRISRKTRDKVRELAKSLGYHPSSIPNALRTGKTKTIGMVIPSITNPFFPRIIQAVENVALQHDYMVIVCNSEEDLHKEIRYFEMFRHRWIDGIIISGVRGTDEEEKNYMQKLEEKDIPFVLIDRDIEGYYANAVVVDQREITYSATRYLIDLGHKHVAFIGAPPETKILKERVKGYREAMEENKIDVDEKLIMVGDQSIEVGEQAIEKFLRLSRPPTAIFACGDYTATGCMRGIQKRGLNIPGDMSVIGFDDVPLASCVNPPLTTINQPVYEMGRKAMDLLLENIITPNLPKSKILLKAKLVIRESTGKAKIPEVPVRKARKHSRK